MRNFYKRVLTSTILPTVLLFYILISIYQNNTEKTSEKKLIKSLVGYSFEYQTTEELKQTYKCNHTMKPTIKLNNTPSLEYDNNLNVYFLRAFFDNRLSPYNYIRVVAFVPNNLTLFCQVWRNGKHSDSRKASVTIIWSPEWDKNQTVPYVPALINCLDTPGLTELPNEITFTKTPCEDTKFLMKIKTTESKLNSTFTICVKPLVIYPGIYKILKEWVSINLSLGVKKFSIYYKTLPENFKKIPNVNFIHFKLPKKLHKTENSFQSKTWLKRKLEVLAYNDCFYSNLYNSEFIIPLDIDELLVPKIDKNLQEIFSNFKISQKVSSFSVKNVYFFEKYPQNATRKLQLNLVKTNSIFSRKIRSKYFSPGVESVKSIIYIPNTLTIFNHFSYHVLGPSIRQIVLPSNVVQLNHYRNNCDSVLIDDCFRYLNSVVVDDSLYRFVNFSR